MLELWHTFKMIWMEQLTLFRFLIWFTVDVLLACLMTCFEVSNTYTALTRKAKNHTHLLSQFTTQWRKDYLLGLRKSQARSQSWGSCCPIHIGDIIVLKNDFTKRILWKLKEPLLSSDGKVRAAVVKLASSDGRPQVLRRSVKRLFPIEVKSDLTQAQNTDNSSPTIPESSGMSTRVHPWCQAAIYVGKSYT